MKRVHCMVVIGTRPEAIKMAPVVLGLRKHKKEIRTTVAFTGQHRELAKEVLQSFKLRADFDLNLMQRSQTLSGFLSRALDGLTELFVREGPDVVLIQGDTTTVLAASMAAFYRRIAIGHVEAGLRTRDKLSPFPEEINRRLTGVLADLHFAPTPEARENLLKEMIEGSRIFVTGNTVIDALRMVRNGAVKRAKEAFPFLANGKRTVLVTAHRRENLGEPLREICLAVSRLVEGHKDVQVIWPVHSNPSVSDIVRKAVGQRERIYLVEPIEYFSFVGVMALSSMVLTDSGGVQEEAPALGKPVLVLRDTTERPEGVRAGTAKLIGTAASTIVEQASRILESECLYREMSVAINPYGDGRASHRIISAIRFHFGFQNKPPESFVSRLG